MKDPVIDSLMTLLVTGAALKARLDAVYGQFGLTSSGFNVLRILSTEPDGYSRGAIAQRLISRAPDVTRLIDRLERQGLVKRVRTRADRRLSVTKITPKGAALAARVEPALEEFRIKMAPKLSLPEWRELSRSCERLAGNEAEPPIQG
jgi:DNA-binding MarR family transcriptional regulator